MEQAKSDHCSALTGQKMNSIGSILRLKIEKVTSNPTEELLSSSKPRNCRALLPLSTAVTASFREQERNKFQFKITPTKQASKQTKSLSKKPIPFPSSQQQTFARSNPEQTLNDLPINKAVVDGEDVNVVGIGGAEFEPVDLLRSPPPRNGAVSRHGI